MWLPWFYCLSDVRGSQSVNDSMISDQQQAEGGPVRHLFYIMCRLSVRPLKSLIVRAKTGGKSMYSPPPHGDVSCLGKCQKDQPDAETSVSLIHSLKTPYGDSPLVVWVRNN